MRRFLAVCAGLSLLRGRRTGADGRPEGDRHGSRPRLRGRRHYRLQSAGDVQMSPDGSAAGVRAAVHRRQRQNRTHVWVMSVSDAKMQRITPDDRDDSSPRVVARREGAGVAVRPAWSIGNRRSWPPPSAISSPSPGSIAARPTGRGISGHQPSAPSGLGRTDRLGAGRPRDRVSIRRRRSRGSAGDPLVITRYGYKSWSGMSDNRRWHIYVVTLADKQVRRLTDGHLPGALDRLVAEG